MKTSIRARWIMWIVLATLDSAYGASLCATVLDPANHPLPGATLSVFNLIEPKINASATSDRNGRVCVVDLPEGLYSAEVSKTGFINSRYYPVRIAVETTRTLVFALPFGEIHEGGLDDVVVSGTIKEAVPPYPSLRICLSRKDSPGNRTCADTNDLGQYAFVVRPGTFLVEVIRQGKTLTKSEIVLSTPGLYQDRIALTQDQLK